MNDRVFSGGDGLVPGSMDHRAYEIMMKSELRNGKGAYEIGNAGAAASGLSFGPFQYDLGANPDGRHLLESIIMNATDAQGHRIISDQELTSIKNHLYKPFNAFTGADRTVYTQMKPKLDAALGSEAGVLAIDADFVAGIKKKVTAMNTVVDDMKTESNKSFLRHSDVAKLILIDTKNQYGSAVNNGLKEFIDKTKDDPAMKMPGRSTGATIKVDGEFGLDDMIRYKLETQYGQSNEGAKDVLRRISHCIEAAGVENVKGSLSAEDKTFFETGLEKYLKDHGRDTKILDNPQLKALAELGGRQQYQTSSAHHAAIDHLQHASTLREHDHGAGVRDLQTRLVQLGIHDAHGRTLVPDSDFGPATKAAVEAFQRSQNLHVDGIAGMKTLEALEQATQPQLASTLADTSHPGHAMYLQALDGVHGLDAQQGRAPDQLSANLAAALAVAAQGHGMTRIDQVVLSTDASRAFAVQGPSGSLFKQYTDVDVMQAVGTPVAQSSVQWPQAVQHVSQAQTTPPVQQMQSPQVDQSVMQH